ncbi:MULTISPECIES: contact-dependent growth inhibition system immunity protein [Acetobacter]|uniref:DUF1436 domain-containing protein n=1 Tax=Acetobacter tropicalis TaxID=104102 RepID=A0A291PED6_9PROT|nr:MULTISPECIES: contact-dependent growth inhibition system immunity protein [Acetobacter]ATJ89796.1 hypothetical protein CIW82_02855 [Acetobacter tropicalis]MCP1197727.1 contact-dependent growth inhibition system immunity protein [Acetobacter senegalensis]
MNKQFNKTGSRLANIIRTRKYYAVICRDDWGSSLFSPFGVSVVIPRKQVSTIWIGKNMRKALTTSRDSQPWYGDGPIPQKDFEQTQRRSREAEQKFWFGIRDEYAFKDHLAAMSKSALVFINWDYGETDQIRLLASRGQGGGHSAWYEGENQGKVFHVSINASDEELGAVALQALDACQPNYA